MSLCPWGVETEIPTPGLAWGLDGTAVRAPGSSLSHVQVLSPPPERGVGAASAQHCLWVTLVLAHGETPGPEGLVRFSARVTGSSYFISKR